MCGIVGIASRGQLNGLSFSDAMRDSMSHRGPDDSASWVSNDRRVWLGHRRLAIIDVSPSGRQPMEDHSQSVCVVFNGEIYNYKELRQLLEGKGHRFVTATDTEVILEAYRAWGTNCLQHFNGMFAFALYDRIANHLFMARDRAGEKPLYYYSNSERMMFASELKALMANPTVPRVLNPAAFEHYLAYGYVPGELCILNGVKKLEQGTALLYELDKNRVRTWAYWELPSPMDGEGSEITSLMDELEELLLDSIKLQLHADVPVGILLSGGLDSSLVTALAARVSTKPVRTFSVAFPGHGKVDETEHARLIAEYFGTDHTELIANSASVDLLPKLARQYDEPLADSSMVPTYLLSREIRRHATVALGGDGGDELFGGYRHYNWLQCQERLRGTLTPSVRRLLQRSVIRIPCGVRGRNGLLGLVADDETALGHANLLFDETSRMRLLGRSWNRRHLENGLPETVRVERGGSRQTVIDRLTAMDFQSYLVDDVLTKVDRASMLASLEVRAPWLDWRVIEFAFGRVPHRLRATATHRKVLPKLLADRLLPSHFDSRRKQGFSIPISAWFKGEWGEYMETVLKEGDDELFDQQTVAALISGQKRGFSNAHRLFSLVMFELWRKHYRVSTT